MNDQAMTRMEKLASLKLGPTELSDRVGGRYSYWRDLLNGNKSFGEKIARKTENALDLPRGWLDNNLKMEAIDSKRPEPATHELSNSAYELAKLFDMLPEDRIKRTVAYSAASAEILKVLQTGDRLPIAGKD